MKKIELLFIVIVVISILLSCSKKDNIIGYNEDIIVKDTTLTSAINYRLSFKDSSNNYNENSKLIVGKFNNAEVRSLLKFENLPDTSWLNSVIIDSCAIIIKKKKLFDTDFNINVYQVTKDWKENSVTSDSLWNEYDSLNVLAEFSISQDTITFSIDTTLVKDWIESDSTNFGIMLKCDGNLENNFVEFFSSETDDCSSLIIVYTDSLGNDSTIVYKVSEDAFIGFDESFVSGDTLSYPMIGNIYPTRTVINFPDYDSLSDLLNLSPEELRKITINKATIIFDSTMIGDNFVSDDYLEIKPYYVLDTNNVVPNIETNYISGCKTAEFHSDDKLLNLNITGIIQGYIRSELKNNQILLKSTSENKDFSYIKFAGDSKPHLIIVYTKPVLED